MPRLTRIRRGSIAKPPEEAESTVELKVQKLALLLDKCSKEGILDHKALLGKDDCRYCPVKKRCDVAWDECTKYSKDLDYNEAKVKLEEIFAEKREFAGGNGNRTRGLGGYRQKRKRIIKQIAELQHETPQLTQHQIADQLGISLRTASWRMAILKQKQENGNDKTK